MNFNTIVKRHELLGYVVLLLLLLLLIVVNILHLMWDLLWQ